jgi:hypothetical protein
MNRTLLVGVATLLVSVVQLSSCANQSGTPAAQGRTPAYSEGFNDGCVSGRASRGSMSDWERKNVSRFDSDKQYAQGWSAAFDKCAYEQTQKMAAGGD